MAPKPICFSSPEFHISIRKSLENQYIINCNCPVFYITCTEYCYFTEKDTMVKYRSMFLSVYAYTYKHNAMCLKELYEKFPKTQFMSEYVFYPVISTDSFEFNSFFSILLRFFKKREKIIHIRSYFITNKYKMP